MDEYVSKQRRSWISDYLDGRNVSATCRKFSISRGTFYKWLKRYDPDRPTKPLRSKSRRPLTKRARSWSRWDLIILAELDMTTKARLGAGKLAERLNRHEFPFSRATVGRMLARIRRRCPTCRAVRGHDPLGHVLNRDLLSWETKRNEERARLGLPALDLFGVGR